jgi:hypothetical protein
VLKTDFTFQEYADLHLILDEACDNGAAAVWLKVERSHQQSMFHAIDHHIRETGAVRPSMLDGGR